MTAPVLAPIVSPTPAPALPLPAGRRLWAGLRGGAWLTPERLRVYPWMVAAASLLGLLHVVATAHGLTAADGQPLGTDFSDVHAAGRLALQGRAPDAYDWALHHAAEQATFGPATPYYGWHYPPPFLLVAALLATLPYLPALLVWQGLTLPIYLGAVRMIVRRRGWLGPAVGFPAVWINLGHGHNGFLTAGLFGLGLACLDRRPWLAGLALGALVYKPQFAVLVPLALLAGGYWRALAATLLAGAALSLLSLAVFGPETWAAFRNSLVLTRTVVLEQGSTGWFKIQTAFAALRGWGAGIGVAYAGQAAVTAAALAGTLALWWRGAPLDARAAALIAGALLATPYSLDYDMMALGPALAFLAARGLRQGFHPHEASALAMAWVAPLLARTVGGAAGLPLGFMATGLVFVLACRAGLRPAARHGDRAPDAAQPDEGVGSPSAA